MIRKNVFMGLLLGSSLLVQNQITAAPSTFDVDTYATANLLNSSTTDNTVVQIIDHSVLNYLDQSTAGDADIFVDSTSVVNFEDESHSGSGVYTLGTLAGDSGIANFNQTSTDTFTGQFAGSGIVNKTGPARLVLTGNSAAFAGNTNVTGGKLVLQNTLGNDVNVGLNGRIGTSGRVGHNLTVDGRVTPNNGTPGTLSVGNDYFQTGASTYEVVINGASNSLIDVDGVADIEGTVQIDSATNVLSTQYTILHADGGVVGLYDNLVQSSFIHFELFYDPFNVFLNFAGSDLSSVALTKNQRHVAATLDDPATVNAAQLTVLGAFVGLTPEQARDGLDSIAGEQYTYLTEIVQGVDHRFAGRLFNSVRDKIDPCGCELGCGNLEVWADVQYGRAFAEGNSEARGLKDSNFDVSLGGLTKVGSYCIFGYQTPEFLLGVAGNYGQDYVHFNEGGHTRLHTGQAALYYLINAKNYYLYSDYIVGHTHGDYKRPITVGDLELRAKSKLDSWHATSYSEIGLNHTVCNLLLQPFVGYENGYFHWYKVKESGAGAFDLKVKQKNVYTFNTYVGTHFSAPLYQCWTISGDLAWQHRFNSIGNHARVGFEDFGNNFTIEGSNPGRNSIIGALNIAGYLYETAEFYLEFSGEKWNRWTSYGITGGLSYNF